MKDQYHHPERFDHVFGTLLWGIALGMVGGLAVSIGSVLMMFSAGEQWNSINWPFYGLFCLAMYVAPLATV